MAAKKQILVCANHRPGAQSCGALGGAALAPALWAELERRGLDWEVHLSICLGQCSKGPNVRGTPGGPFVHQCTSTDAPAIIQSLLDKWGS